jgi:hypothetical protein
MDSPAGDTQDTLTKQAQPEEHSRLVGMMVRVKGCLFSTLMPTGPVGSLRSG